MAAASTFVSVEEYLRTSFDPDAEYVNGQIEERTVGENDHSVWQGAVYSWFRQHAEEWQIRARTELRVQVSTSSFRVPDVTILDRRLPTEQIITRPPLAVIEILSPGDTFRSVMAKCKDYEQMGIATILVLDPDGRHFRFISGQVEALQPRSFVLSGTTARFDLDEIEKLLD